MIEIGKIHNFVVIQENRSGYQLKSIDCGHEVFMPPALAERDLEKDQELKAFVYLDSTGGLIATEKLPYAAVGEYALLKTIDIQHFGAFFDWGIQKDLLVPDNEQKEKIHNNEKHLVRVCLDKKTNRIFGTTKLGKYIKNSIFDIPLGSKIEIVPVDKSRLGYRSIINKKFIGMIYYPEIFVDIEIGKPYDGVVKKIRDDGLVDASLQIHGVKKFVSAKEQILSMLINNDGHSNLNDKSPPHAIKEALGMSKQTFKKTIGILYKERKILINDDGIILLKNNK